MPQRTVHLLLRLWRKKRLRRRVVHVRHNASPAPKFVDGEAFHFCGTAYTLRVMQDVTRAQGCLIEGDALCVNLGTELSKRDARAETRVELSLWYKREARRDFRERLDMWAEKLDVRYNRMIVTNPLRRWGSCNYRNDIRLNWRLMFLPPELIDYVVAHELCHVRHKNHSRHFWNELASVMPDWQSRRLALRHWENHSW